MLTFSKWLSLQEDAGQLGPGGSTIYINDKRYREKGCRSGHTTQDDDGESGPPKPANSKKKKRKPEALFGFVTAAMKKCKK